MQAPPGSPHLSTDRNTELRILSRQNDLGNRFPSVVGQSEACRALRLRIPLADTVVTVVDATVFGAPACEIRHRGVGGGSEVRMAYDTTDVRRLGGAWRTRSTLSTSGTATYTLVVSPGQVGVIGGTNGGSDLRTQTAITNVQDANSDKALANQLNLTQQLNNLTLQPGETITQLLARARIIWEQLKAAGIQKSEQEVALSVLSGLPDEFSTLVTVLQNQSGPLTLDSIQKAVLTEQQRANKVGASTSAAASTKAFYTQKSSMYDVARAWVLEFKET
eukprot:jgi/Chrzof1/7097/Cz02g10210.t1